MTTMADIARLAGCSKVTVSRVLNEKPDVSPDTRSRVLRLVRELRYAPDARARGIARKRSHTIGLVLAHLGGSAVADHVQAIERTARRRGYQLILCNSGEDVARERECLRLLRSHRVDGVVIMPCRFEAPHIAELRQDGVPVVLLHRYLRDVALDAVLSDHREAARLATVHLARAGRRRIAFARRQGLVSTVVDRLDGYRAGLRQVGLEYDATLVLTADQSVESGREVAGRLLHRPAPPDAILAYNDIQAFGVLQGLLEHGRRVPDDVAIVGADNLAGCEVLTVPLTTIAQDGPGIGERAMSLLVRRIEKPTDDGPRRILVPPRLIVRESCGARRAGVVVDEASA
jgi:LacI family transcriptional regulator